MNGYETPFSILNSKSPPNLLLDMPTTTKMNMGVLHLPLIKTFMNTVMNKRHTAGGNKKRSKCFANLYTAKLDTNVGISLYFCSQLLMMFVTPYPSKLAEPGYIYMERQWMHKGGNNNFAARQNKR
jgi:hypothetical protein